MQLDAAESLAMSNKRIANILRSAPEETKTTSNPELFETSEERSLHDAVNKLSTSLESAIKERDYVAVLESLSMLKNPVDEFFDSVLVMTDDSAQRQNRIALLHQLRELFLEVADLSCIPNA